MNVSHAALASLLGARRQSVSSFLQRLGADGVLALGPLRGRIAVKDAAGLERLACTCYRANFETYRKVMGFVARGSVTMGQPPMTSA
jgi:hypothetical protein